MGFNATTYQASKTLQTDQVALESDKEGAEPLGRMIRSLLDKFYKQKKDRPTLSGNEESLQPKESPEEKLKKRESRLHHFVKIRDDLLEKMKKEGEYSEEDREKLHHIKRKISSYKRAIKGEIAFQKKVEEFKLDEHGMPLEIHTYIDTLKKQIHEHQKDRNALRDELKKSLSEKDQEEIQERIEEISEEISQKKVVARELREDEKLGALEKGETWKPKNQKTQMGRASLVAGSRIIIPKTGKLIISRASKVSDSGRNHTEL